jgi:outer membrane lipoprotein SlyB
MKRVPIYTFIWAAIAALLVSGCASTLSGESYSRDEARRPQQVQIGVIEFVRPVVIEGTKTPIGAGAGAIVGGIAGSSVGGGRGSAISSVLGSVAGGMAGAVAEEQVTKRQGIEVTVRLENGKVIAVVQEETPKETFTVGERVRVLTISGATRVSH